MERYKLRNGLRLVVDRRKSETVAVMACVLVGSVYEKGNEGICHLLEHMLFEGTGKRKNAKEIAAEVEGAGGVINAFTNHERTCFFVKVPKQYFTLAVDILSDIIQNAKITENKLKKEKRVILKEINMALDEPRVRQFLEFYKTIFPGHPAGKPIFGTAESVNSLTHAQVMQFYKKHYVPNNMIISVVGDIPNPKRLIEKKFSFRPKSYTQMSIMPPRSQPAERVVKGNAINSYFVLGHQTVSSLHPDSCALDVAKAILGRGQSGILFDEIRNKRGLVYEIGVNHDSGRAYGIFSVFLNTEKKNLGLCRSIIFKELSRLKNISSAELKEAIGFISGSTILEHEGTEKRAEDLCFWESLGNAGLIDSYIKRIKKVSKADIARVAKKYLLSKPTIVTIKK
ncbi:MAG TPA: pitrilysin family protein [Candidatus Nanoarchaeia archaeon]|nr:pitrilysin family protein [Candidatus Nanoarchaeia archaeon]